MKHPLYGTFQTLIHRREKEEELLCHPSFEDYIVKSPPPFSAKEYRKIGCLVLAGGEGTRLGLDVPKGCAKPPYEEKKSLFQILFEKVKAKGVDLPLSLMTSPLNHEATVAYLERHDYFGLTNLDIFKQGLMPICDDRGRVVFDMAGTVIKSPDGNGRALFHLYHSGVLKRWLRQGVEVVQVIPIDNPLAEPFDLELLSQHQPTPVDLVLRCIKRMGDREDVGIIDIKGRKLMVREYSEVPSYTSHLSYPYGNSGIFSCSIDFVKKISSIDLPWHLARKQAPRWSRGPRWIWKFETLILDIFPAAQHFKILVSERNRYFAPLKTLTHLHGTGEQPLMNAHIRNTNT